MERSVRRLDGSPIGMLLIPPSLDHIAVASHRTTLDGKATRWEPPGRLNLKASSVRQFSEFRERAVLTSQQDHHQQLGVSSAIRGHSAQDHQAAAGTRCLGTAAQDQPGFPVRPVVENRLEEIEIRTSW
jgi:hypothetical protein